MSCSVLCTNLSASVRLSHLTDLFSACGQIVSSEIEGESNPHARCLLQFGDSSAASMAEMLDGTPLGDMAMRVQSVSYNTLKEAPAIQAPVNIISSAPSTQTLPTGTTANPTEPVVFSQDDRLLRTIYVGNLSPSVLTEHVIGFLAPIGAAIINIKMCPGGGSATAHAFVEFGCVRHAQMALSLSGTELHGRNVKVGMAENPIQAAGEGTADLRKRELALEKVRLAQERLKMKAMGLAPKDEETPKDSDKSKERARSQSRSRSRSKRRHRSRSRRSRSRDRHRRHRRRHRSRSRSRSRRRSRSRSRSMPRFSSARSLNYSRPSGRKKQAVQPANMIWDGFQWIPKPPQIVQQQPAPASVPNVSIPSAAATSAPSATSAPADTSAQGGAKL